MTVARSDIERAADRYRRSIDARDRTALRATLRAYRLAIESVESRIRQLEEGLAAHPEKEWRSYAIQQQESLRESLQHALDEAAITSGRSIDDQRVRAFVEARDVTRAAIMESLQAAGHATIATQLGGAVNRRSVEAMIAQVQSKSAVTDMLRRHSKTGARAAADRLVTAVMTGENPRKIAGSIRASLQHESWKALRIARTEVIRAHTAGAISQMREYPAITPMYEWMAETGSACVACLAEHGSLHPTSEPPARHPNCRCICAPVVIDPTTGKPLSEPGETGQDVIDRMSPHEAQKRFGKRRGELLTRPGAGRVPIADMLTHRESDTWGRTVAVVPLKDLTS